MLAILFRRAPSAPRPWGVWPLLGVALPAHHSLRVWQRHRDVFFRLWRAELFPPIAEPVVMILALGLGLGAFVDLSGDRDYIQFLAPGILAIFPMFAAVVDSLWGAFLRLTQQGTYAAMLATPVRAEDIIAGDILWAATRATMSATVIVIVLALFTPFYDLIESPLVIAVIPNAFLMGLLFASLGMAYVGFVRSISQLTYFFTLIVTPMFWFSGAFFPLDELPSWAEILAWFIPLTHVVDINRGLITGDLQWQHLGDLAWLLIVTVGAFWLALRSMRRRLIE